MYYVYYFSCSNFLEITLNFFYLFYRVVSNTFLSVTTKFLIFFGLRGDRGCIVGT